MARRTWAELAALLADNATGEISEADLRDAVIDSAMPHVEARPPTSTDNATNNFDVGHTWIDTSASPMPEAWRCVFSNTSAAVWSRIEGAPGAPGSPGAAGATWHTVTSEPDTGLGNPGDYALDSVTFNLYQKTDETTWALLGNVKGPKGDEGEPGADGGIQPEDGMVVIIHGANASTPRTAGAAAAYWQGSVPPDERLLGDWWLYTTVYD